MKFNNKQKVIKFTLIRILDCHSNQNPSFTNILNYLLI